MTNTRPGTTHSAKRRPPLDCAMTALLIVFVAMAMRMGVAAFPAASLLLLTSCPIETAGACVSANPPIAVATNSPADPYQAFNAAHKTRIAASVSASLTAVARSKASPGLGSWFVFGWSELRVKTAA